MDTTVSIPKKKSISELAAELERAKEAQTIAQHDAAHHAALAKKATK